MKIPHNSIRSSLAKHATTGPAGDAELKQLRAAVWHQQGIVIVRLDDIPDDWDRLHLANIATQLYGQRTKEAR
ncbi:hypothetical protein FNU76_01745 [Chitinimonas arctica]|uniref:Uncharacterized protein n=1 Tax=Chitinimonas arctica TaxID=2594795 RepID=A0A516SAK5_9NEIS|nr:hypothetical protein [Chitinimonas arctica]QDQ25181.1 hypothetical protein FNU76_01745 [Chitinimonas arctica]